MSGTKGVSGQKPAWLQGTRSQETQSTEKNTLKGRASVAIGSRNKGSPAPRNLGTLTLQQQQKALNLKSHIATKPSPPPTPQQKGTDRPTNKSVRVHEVREDQEDFDIMKVMENFDKEIDTLSFEKKLKQLEGNGTSTTINHNPPATQEKRTGRRISQETLEGLKFEDQQLLDEEVDAQLNSLTQLTETPQKSESMQPIPREEIQDLSDFPQEMTVEDHLTKIDQDITFLQQLSEKIQTTKDKLKRNKNANEKNYETHAQRAQEIFQNFKAEVNKAFGSIKNAQNLFGENMTENQLNITIDQEELLKGIKKQHPDIFGEE